MDPNVLRSFSAEMKKEALLGTLLTMPVRHVLGKRALEREPDTARQEKLRKLLSKGDPTEIRILPDGSKQGPHYDSDSKKQWVSVRDKEDPAVLAHELGHSELDREFVGSVLQSKLVRIGTAVGGIGGAYAASRGHLTIGAAIAASSYLPVLAYEGMASMRGIDRMKRVGATEEELAAAKSKLLKAWGTYATMPVASAGDALTAGALSRLGRG
jgi:hypothetical protein